MFDSSYFNRNKTLSRYQLAKLHTFETTARHQSFALAAKELCITPSAVSHQINQLENELGFKLFNRYHRRIVLSTEGKKLFNTLQKLLHKLNQDVLDIKNQEISRKFFRNFQNGLPPELLVQIFLSWCHVWNRIMGDEINLDKEK